MLPYLHILIRIEKDGSLHAQGAFTSKEKLLAYQKETGLEDSQVRLDFYNGPFDQEMEVIYAAHRRWNMDRFQLGGYFKSEAEAWDWVTSEGYVNLLRIDLNYQEEKQFEQEALERYAKLQKRWRLVPYQSLIAAEGPDKARAKIVLSFYQDALESFKPKTTRDVRPFYAFAALILLIAIAVFFYLKNGPDYGENAPGVAWLPDYVTDVSFYRSQQVSVYEFQIEPDDFKTWARQNGMEIQPITSPLTLSRYKAYIHTPKREFSDPAAPADTGSEAQSQDWQNQIRITVKAGMIATGDDQAVAAYDLETKKAYYQQLKDF